MKGVEEMRSYNCGAMVVNERCGGISFSSSMASE